jgi:hypothetical protein
MAEKTSYAPCVGSGMCCWKAPCDVALGKYTDMSPWLSGEGCPSLRWDEKLGRYFCREVEEGGPEVKEQLYIGAGCCMSLFNDNRMRILQGKGRPWTPKDKEQR